MKIINMLDDYEQLCKESDIHGNWIAWKNYVSKYESLFNGILKVLYMSNLEDLKPIIETVNFKEMYIKAKENVANGYIEETIKWVNTSLDYFGNSNEFILYIGCEMGNIGGCVLPIDDSVIVYFSMEAIKDINFLKVLVPHEMNHLARALFKINEENANVEDINMLKERLVSEGLGVFSSFRLLELEDNLENLSKIVGIPTANIQTLIDQEDRLEKEIFEQIGETLNSERMYKYFAFTEEDILLNKPIYSGYFIGFRIIQKLYNTNKYSFKELTTLSADKILEEYLKIS